MFLIVFGLGEMKKCYNKYFYFVFEGFGGFVFFGVVMLGIGMVFFYNIFWYNGLFFNGKFGMLFFVGFLLIMNFVVGLKVFMGFVSVLIVIVFWRRWKF